jgi:hypothetical protein
MGSDTSRRQFLKSIPSTATAAWAATSGLSLLKLPSILHADSQSSSPIDQAIHGYEAPQLGMEWQPPAPSAGGSPMPGAPPVQFPVKKSQTDSINGIGYMHTDITLASSGQLTAVTHTWSAKDFEGFHGSVAVALLDQNQKLLWVSKTQTYGVDGKHVPFGHASDRNDSWRDTVPAQALSAARFVAIKQRWSPKAVSPDDIANWLRGIGNDVGNELKPIAQAIETIVQDLSSPTIEYSDTRGYKYVETSDKWKQMCTAFPCFAAIEWPDYATKWFPASIAGKPAVIQLWKGYCEKFLGLERFPGGIGAEVGIYRFIPGRARPKALPFLPPGFAGTILKPMANLTDKNLWWAYPELGTQLHFNFINPITGAIFFSAGTEKSYWLNKWMNTDSYEKYKRDQGNGKTPPFAVDYRLEFSINGKSYGTW